MKKTLTINLNGIIFHIDEDAFESLQEYQQEIERCYSADDEREIVNDIEARIAELLNERLNNNKKVVTIDDINHVIATLGHPDTDNGEFTNEEQEEPKGKKNRPNKFYRDIDNQIIGGVAAGLAAYTGIDVTLVRLILVILTFFMGWTIPLYLIVWAITPAADTVARKVEMHGNEPTIENIRRFATSEQFKSTTSRLGNRLGQVIPWLFKIAAICVGVLLAGIGIIVTMGLIVLAICMIFGVLDIFMPLPSEHLWLGITCGIALLTTIAIPTISIIISTVRLLSGKPRRQRSHTGWIWFIVWLFAIVVTITTGLICVDRSSKSELLTAISNITRHNTFSFIDEHVEANAIIEQRLTGEQFSEIEVVFPAKVVLIKDSISFVEVKSTSLSMRGIFTTIENNRLVIDANNLRSRYNPVIYVHYTQPITNITATGASHVESTEPVRAHSITIESMLASDVDLNIICDSLIFRSMGASDIDCTVKSRYALIESLGASDIDMQAECDTLDLEVLGASDADMRIKGDVVNIDVAGASDADLDINCRLLTATAKGASDVDIKGRCDYAQINALGGSGVSIRGLDTRDKDENIDMSSIIYK